jgi:hypothetical protein
MSSPVELPATDEDLQIKKTVSEYPETDQLLGSLKPLDNASDLKWIPFSEFTDIELIQDSANEKTYFAKSKRTPSGNISRDEFVVLILLLGTDIPQELIHKAAQAYSLTADDYKDPLKIPQFKRYATLLERRNKMILGFTKNNSDYYLMAQKQFYHCHSLYGFCSACGVLRCSPVWCICGHKELSDSWTSNNQALDEFIRKSQRQTRSANEAYLEWLPFDWFSKVKRSDERVTARLSGDLPISNNVVLIPLDISDETDDSYYRKVSSLS